MGGYLWRVLVLKNNNTIKDSAKFHSSIPNERNFEIISSWFHILKLIVNNLRTFILRLQKFLYSIEFVIPCVKLTGISLQRLDRALNSHPNRVQIVLKCLYNLKFRSHLFVKPILTTPLTAKISKDSLNGLSFCSFPNKRCNLICRYIWCNSVSKLIDEGPLPPYEELINCFVLKYSMSIKIGFIQRALIFITTSIDYLTAFQFIQCALTVDSSLIVFSALMLQSGKDS